MRRKGKLTIRRIAKKIAIFLIVTVFANLAGIYFAPQKVQAVDANDHMLLFWPSVNCADTPSGWTAVSDGAGEDFNAYFPRGASSYSGKAGGSSTHTHVIDAVTTTGIAATAGDRNAGADYTGANNSHTHTNNSATIDAGGAPTVLPKYGEMCVIRYDNGIPNGNSAIPNGAVAIFDAAPPAGWNDYSSTFSAGSDTFIRGGSNGTGGSNSHGGATHSLTNITIGNAVSGTVTGQSSSKSDSSTTHTHTAPNTSSDTPDVQPPYMNIYLGQKSTTGPIPNGMIAMFDDTDSSVGFSVAGWTRLSDGGGPFDGKFLKVTGSYGSPGGATTHTHTVTTTSNDGGEDESQGKAGTGGPIMLHSHNVSISLNVGTNTNIPPYTNAVIAKKQTVITTLSTDKADYGQSETIQISTTVNNYHGSTALADTYIDAVIFIDADADGRPDAGETYITNGCLGSAVWASGNYTHQNNNVDVAASGSANDNWTCDNDNFPSITTYTLWAHWWDGITYAYNIYYEKSVTFTSVPTLTELLFMVMIGCAVFIGVRTGVIKMRKNGQPEPKEPPKRPNHKPNYHIHQSSSSKNQGAGSIDGVSKKDNIKLT